MILLIVAFAAFLLLERMQIRQTLFGWLGQGLQMIEDLGKGLAEALSGLASTTTLSDLIGYVLLLAALVVVLWRVRWRLMRSPRLSSRNCPDCDRALHRVHRRWIDRVVNLVVPVARFQCKNPDCRWRGLRVRGNHR